MKGFTLIELLISTALLLLIIGSFFFLLKSQMLLFERRKDFTLALTLMENKLEELKAEPFESVAGAVLEPDLKQIEVEFTKPFLRIITLRSAY